MSDWNVSELAEEFKRGRLSRRQFIARMAGVGLTAPVIATVLAACGSSNSNKNGNKASSNTGSASNTGAAATSAASAAPSAGASAAQLPTGGITPTKRGGGGQIKLLWWQSPTLPQPHLSNGTKDFDASRIFYEPLAEYDTNANLYPVLAAEIPSIENGGVAKDGTSVTWKLKQGVTWHDGQPFTADDVVFTYQYIADPATSATTLGNYVNVSSVDKIDANTIKVNFKQPTPFWQTAFTAAGSAGMIIPQHIFGQYKGANARNAPNNLKPLGTGPYKFDSFVPGDNLQASIYPNYHIPNRPFFDSIYMKGGGDAVSAARAVLQTGDYDYGWNMQVEYDQLQQFQKGGPGTIVIYPGSSAEHINFNLTDPNQTVDGQISSIQTKHPFFSDPKVRAAFALLFDRKTVQTQLYGAEGQLVSYLVYNPSKYIPSPASQWEYNAAKAGQMLDAAGWTKGSDGTRAKNGVKMHVVFVTSVNSLRQNEQAIVKQTLQANGITVDLKSVDANIFFGDPTNPDNLAPFHADMSMYTNGPGVDPLSYLRDFVSTTGKAPNDNIAQKENNWSQPNVTRYANPAFDKLWQQAAGELDPVKLADLYKQMNQIIFDDAPEVPLVARNGVSVAKSNLQGVGLNPWQSSDLSQLAYWNRKS
jgi:peptide/nickel transport system substrate-binding protein